MTGKTYQISGLVSEVVRNGSNTTVTIASTATGTIPPPGGQTNLWNFFYQPGGITDGEAALLSQAKNEGAGVTVFFQMGGEAGRKITGVLVYNEVNITAPAAGQVLAEIINSNAILTVSSTAAFTGPGYILLADTTSNFALVQFQTTTANGFKTLALPAGNGAVTLTGEMVVHQAPQGETPAGTSTTLGASTFTVDAGPTFAGTGYLYILADGGGGIVQYDLATSTLPTPSTQGVFNGAVLLSIFGSVPNQNPFDFPVNAGTVVIESSPPLPEITFTTAATNVTAATPFTLKVVSTEVGFASPSGSLLVNMLGQNDPVVISYTGTTSTSFTNATSNTTGTITMGTSVAPTATNPITFTFTNNTGSTQAIYAAIAGQCVDITGAATYGYLSAGNGIYEFQSFGQLTEVPHFTLFPTNSQLGATVTLKIPNSPFGRLDSNRIVFSIGTPPIINIVAGKPQFPAPANHTDPDNSITYDFAEFTERSAPNDGVLFINTTQVDQVGIAFTMQTTPRDAVKSKGVGIDVAYSTLQSKYATYINHQFAGAAANPNTTATIAAFNALNTTHRLLNPSDAIQNPPASMSALDSFYDSAFSAFFNNYIGNGNLLILQRNGFWFGGQTVQGFVPPSYTYQATYSNGQLTFANADFCLSLNQTVTGKGINGIATITGISGTTVTLSGTGTNQTQAAPYTFGVPNAYTVLKLQQITSATNTTPVTNGQTYYIYAPYFTNNPFPGGFPLGVSGLTLSQGGTGYGDSGPLVFTDGLGPNGVAATGTYTAENGTITSVTLLSGGSGYISAPTVSIASNQSAVVTASIASPPPPPWIQSASPGLMVFGCAWAFNDGTGQAAALQISGNQASAQTLSDIENTIVSAFNRGIANSVPPGQDVTHAWNLNTGFYPLANTTGDNWSNYYAGFLHNGGVSITTPGSSIGLAYGFAYDDQGGNDPTLTSIFPTAVDITLLSR